MAQPVKNLPAMRETWVQSLGWEDPLDEGIGYPLQYSGLENSMDCIVYEVTKSRARWSDFTHSLMIAIITIVLLPCHIIIVSFLFSE